MNRYIRVLLFILFNLLLTPTWAGINAANGFYLGGDFTYGSFQPVEGAAINSSLIPIAGYVRPFIGYRFTDYLAIEAGYDDLVNDKNNSNREPDHYRLYAIDLSGKFIYPFQSGFSLYAKGGAAYVHQDVYNSVFIVRQITWANSKANKIMPLVGAGVNYNFNQHFSSNLGITHIQHIAPIGSIDMISLGLSYTF